MLQEVASSHEQAITALCHKVAALEDALEKLTAGVHAAGL